MKNNYLILLFCFFIGYNSVAQQSVLFNQVFFTSTFSSSKPTNIQEITGSNFKFTSSSNFADISGNDVAGTLTYFNSNNERVSVSGIIDKRIGNIEAAIFTVGSDNYILILPGNEDSNTGNQTYYNGAGPFNVNSAGVVSALTNLYNSQSSSSTPTSSQSLSIQVGISDPAAVSESSNYLIFTLTFSANRSSGNNVSFTPSITDVSTTSGSDYTNSIEYSEDSNFSTTTTSAPFTVTNTVNTVYLRIPLINDNLVEDTETFVLKTNSFTDSNGDLANGSTGANAIGTISDDGDPYVWNGSSDTNWNNSSNWTPNTVPSSSSNAKIPASLSNYPVLLQNQTINDLEVESGASIDTDTKNLSVNGNLINNGSITNNAFSGKLVLGGSSLQSISGSGSIDNLELNNLAGASITSGSNNQTINRGFFPVNGVLQTNDNLTLNSTSSETAGVFQKGGTCTTYLNGNITLKRYINPNGNATYRFLGNPFNQDKTYADFTNLPLNYTYYYDNSYTTPDPSAANGDPAWTKVTNSSQTFSQHQGIISWVSGSPFTISALGSISQCTVTINLSAYSNNDANKGFVLISNPYAAFLDVSSHPSGNRNGLQNGFYVWDTATDSGDGSSQKSRQSNFNAKGKYVTITPGQSNAASIVPPFGSFFMKLNSGATQVTGSIVFNETEKANNNTVGGYSPFSLKSNPHLESNPNIYILSLINNGSEIDNLVLSFRKEATNQFDNWDLTKMRNSDINFYTKLDSVDYLLAVNTFSEQVEKMEIPVFLESISEISNAEFKLRWEENTLPVDADIYLEDQLNRDRILLSDKKEISFLPGKFDSSTPRFKLLVFPRELNTTENEEVVFYPNPSEDYIYLRGTEILNGDLELKIVNMLGQEIYTKKVNIKNKVDSRIGLEELNSGNYLLIISNELGVKITKKLVKK